MDEVDEVRKMTARLKLDARRPSIVRWKAENEGGAFVARTSDRVVHGFAGHNQFANVGEAIEWIKKELLNLREQDYALARQLISIRSELMQAKLRRSCSEHRALLEDAALDMELQRDDEHDDDILANLSAELGRCPPPLRGIGITRMNLCSRRFSLS